MDVKIYIDEISQILSKMDNRDTVRKFLLEILTEAELTTLSKRWCILKKLALNETQREIASELNVSLCKVTRGSRILKDTDSIVRRILIKEKKNGYKDSK